MNSNFNGLRVAVIGIGNELNGDDAAGVLAARALKVELANHNAIENPAGKENTKPVELLVIDAGPAPENFSGSLRRFRPDRVLLIDAADMGKPDGSVVWVDWQDVEGFSGSTHILSPAILAKFLVQDLGCQVTFIGIQPAALEFLSPVSAAVQKAIDEIVVDLKQRIGL